MRSNNSWKSIILITACILLGVVASFWALRMTDQLFDPIAIPVGQYILRCFLLLVGLLFFWVGTSRLIQLRLTNQLKNLLTGVVALLTITVFLEIILSLTPISSGGGEVLFSRNWMNFYWSENELGYRDSRPEELNRPDKKNILVVGDSYVAGHGLKQESQRFSNLLREQLSDCFDVFNLGVCGADTKAELGFLKSFPVNPDLVLFVHGKNDIQQVKTPSELKQILNINPNVIGTYPKRKSANRFLIKNSFLINSIEYLVFKTKQTQYFNDLQKKHSSLESYLESEEGKLLYLSYYKNEELFSEHLSTIDSVKNWTDSQNAELLILLFPATEDQILLETDRLINQPISKHAKLQGVSTFNLTPVLQQLPEAERQVSRLDPHPSHALNRLIADTLSKIVLEKLTDDHPPCELN